MVFKEGEPPLVTLFAMVRAGDLPERMRTQTWVEPPLVIRAADGSVHPGVRGREAVDRLSAL